MPDSDWYDSILGDAKLLGEVTARFRKRCESGQAFRFVLTHLEKADKALAGIFRPLMHEIDPMHGGHGDNTKGGG